MKRFIAILSLASLLISQQASAAFMVERVLRAQAMSMSETNSADPPPLAMTPFSVLPPKEFSIIMTPVSKPPVSFDQAASQIKALLNPVQTKGNPPTENSQTRSDAAAASQPANPAESSASINFDGLKKIPLYAIMILSGQGGIDLDQSGDIGQIDSSVNPRT